MTQVIWVDNKMRVSGSDNDFEVSLRESMHLSDARIRVDKLTFVDSFFTMDAGQHTYFGAPNNGLSYAIVLQGAYIDFTLASATERKTSYNLMTNNTSHALAGAKHRGSLTRSSPPRRDRSCPARAAATLAL